jgi:isopropylmalate/homocitrate/citramalate synthase
VGNTPMDQLLVNLSLMGWIDKDLTGLRQYCETAADACGWTVPLNYPVFGRDAFRTATGVHAAAVIKCYRKGDTELADLIYSGVPAGQFGLQQVIEIGPMSGKSNVVYWLETRGHEATDDRVTRIYERAKQSSAVLSDEELKGLI